jgi:hypothetical protein
MINRDDIAKELYEEKQLRELVRKGIEIILDNKKHNQIEENRLRNVIRSVIKEAVTGSTEVPHESTGINALRLLLKVIIPIVEKDYQLQTTDKAQRDSYRAHILNAIKHSLAPLDIDVKTDDRPEKSLELEEQGVDIAVDDPEKDKYIPLGDEEEALSPEEEETDKFTIPGEDLTGRNFALKTYKKIENQIIDAYESLGNNEDKETFYDYILTNMKMHFDKFESNITTDTEAEPESPDYEKPSDISTGDISDEL